MINTSAAGRLSRAGLALLLACAAVTVQWRMDTMRPHRDSDDLLYLPNERLLNHFTAGLNNVIADYLWVQCCTYVGRQVKSNWNFEWVRQMVETVVRLDPYFVPAYRYGAMFLAMLKQEDQEALDLLHKGMVINPDSWELPYEAAMVHMLNRKDDPNSKFNAVFYLTLSVETGKAPAYVAEVASSLQGQYNLVNLEKGMWEKVKDSEDPFLRELAKTKLEEVAIRANLSVLEDLLDRYRREFGKPADHLEQLIDVGYISTMAPDSVGGKYFLSPDGQALNETLLYNATRDTRARIESAIRNYREKQGAFPALLDDLVTQGLFEQVPLHPWPGKSWTYDSATGTLGEVQVQEPVGSAAA